SLRSPLSSAIAGPIEEFHDVGAQTVQLLPEHVDPAGRGAGYWPLLFCHGMQERDVRQCLRSFTIARLHASPEHRSRLADVGGLTPEGRPRLDGVGDRGNTFRAPAEHPDETTKHLEYEQAKDRKVERYHGSFRSTVSLEFQR